MSKVGSYELAECKTVTGGLTLAEKLEKAKHLKIVCCCTPNFGHMFPMSRIAIALQDKGHEVHVITVDNKYAREKTPKLYADTGVTLHHTPGEE